MTTVGERMFDDQVYCSKCKAYHPICGDEPVYCCGKLTRRKPRSSENRRKYNGEFTESRLGV